MLMFSLLRATMPAVEIRMRDTRTDESPFEERGQEKTKGPPPDKALASKNLVSGLDNPFRRRQRRPTDSNGMQLGQNFRITRFNRRMMMGSR